MTQWTRETVIADVKRIMMENPGVALNRELFRKHSRVSTWAVDKLFGSFSNMKSELGTDHPSGFSLRRFARMTDGEGTQKVLWETYSKDDVDQELALKAAAEALAESLPRTEPVKAPVGCNSHLLNLFTFSDVHVGMRGKDWNLEIAEDMISRAFQHMMDAAPQAGTAVINQLGDWNHTDGLLPVTPLHGHVLDQDCSFVEMVKTSVRVLRRLISMALEKHEHVHVILAEGNHDIASSVWLRVMFRALYENEPRVTVNESDTPYYVFQHGTTMLAFHHGHLKAKDSLPLLFAAEYPEIWGSTTKRYCHVGHRHHLDVKAHPGMTVTQHSTLAGRDDYAIRGGWLSDREVRVITYHDQFGEQGNNVVCPEMLAI